jgi:hypothetical protein
MRFLRLPVSFAVVHRRASVLGVTASLSASQTSPPKGGLILCNIVKFDLFAENFGVLKKSFVRLCADLLRGNPAHSL